VIRHRDIELGKISSFPSPFPLPLPGTHVSHSKHTQERHQEVLIQRVANKPNIPVPHQTQKLGRIKPRQSAGFRDPFPRIDETHVCSLVSEAVPGVSVEWAGVVVEGFVGRVENPATFEGIGKRGKRGGRSRSRGGGG